MVLKNTKFFLKNSINCKTLNAISSRFLYRRTWSIFSDWPISQKKIFSKEETNLFQLVFYLFIYNIEYPIAHMSVYHPHILFSSKVSYFPKHLAHFHTNNTSFFIRSESWDVISVQILNFCSNNLWLQGNVLLFSVSQFSF